MLSHGPLPDMMKGRQVLPDHSKALSVTADLHAYPHVEVDYQQAIAYLRTEAVTLKADASRGIVLLTYRDFPIGFAKNLGNRANNLYPQAWKIKSSHIPEDNNIVIE